MAAPKLLDAQIARYVARCNWLPTLFATTSKGEVQTWKVGVDGNHVVTQWGLNGGKQQTSVDIIEEGKNLGKRNATTPDQQATLKAQQLHDKKVKDGYMTDIEKAKRGESEIEGIEPMLAFPIEDKEKYVKFPAFTQPKLDGFRCIAMIKNGKCRLFSRTRKKITTLPHIVFELESIFNEGEFVIDGELYNHKLKDDFNKIASTIKRNDIHPDHKIIQYHIYDVLGDAPYGERTRFVKDHVVHSKAPSLRIVDTYNVRDMAELKRMHDLFTVEGYEGAMYRSQTTPYETKRSPGLLKVKVFQDGEFQVIDFVKGAGKFKDGLGAFVCITSHGKKFNVAMNGSIEELEQYITGFNLYKDQMLTVQFQGKTPDGIPRFPRGLRFRVDI
jgi:ATP-dependent DNA ligase